MLLPIAGSWRAQLPCAACSVVLLLLAAGKGDVEPGRPADDLVFIVAEKPHRVFTRNGSDLSTTITIPLETALAGGTAQVRACARLRSSLQVLLRFHAGSAVCVCVCVWCVVSCPGVLTSRLC